MMCNRFTAMPIFPTRSCNNMPVDNGIPSPSGTTPGMEAVDRVGNKRSRMREYDIMGSTPLTRTPGENDARQMHFSIPLRPHPHSLSQRALTLSPLPEGEGKLVRVHISVEASRGARGAHFLTLGELVR